MSLNKEDLKNKIIYRASYRGTKEMDIMVLSYVKKIINDLSYDELVLLDKIINLDDESFVRVFKNIDSNRCIETEIYKFIKKYNL
tara:strand:+ start:112 stop:366 length:255 start_codon:yes stop_codon:yes gene_type:complete